MNDRAAWLTGTTEAGVVAGVTTRWGGCSRGEYAHNNLALHVGDEAECVARNRARLQTQLQADVIQWLDQVHGCRSVSAAKPIAELPPQADGVWTTDRGLALAVMTADCVPVLLWDTEKSVAAAAHAGWRGLHEGVLANLIAQLPVPPSMLTAWIGPAIGAAHYEVGSDVWAAFTAYGGRAVQAHPTDADKRLLDLAHISAVQLTRIGVGQVIESGWCTFADRRFYSHRRASGQPTGRMASVVMLR